MGQMRLRVRLNKGKRGVPLEKLERFVAGVRRFLAAAARDLDVPNPDEWGAVQFRNGSLEWTNESSGNVPAPIIGMFNETISDLSKGSGSRYIEAETTEHWANIFEPLEPREQVGFAIYPDNAPRARWLNVTREVAILASASAFEGGLLPVRESIGAVQGTVHAWYRESDYFTLRELASRALVKCFYKPDDYHAVVLAVKETNQVIHVHGRLYTDTQQRYIREVLADRIIPAEPFTFSDFEKIWTQGKPQ